MKKIIIIAILFISGNIIAQTGKIQLTITDLNPKSGDIIRVALYSKQNFLKSELLNKTIRFNGNTAYISLTEIKFGIYAIAVYQDENLDGKMNTNFYGKPIELSGFSNNAKENFGPSDFKDASFDVFESKSTKLTIHLKK